MMIMYMVVKNSDLILSDLGNDKLDGQGGDDHYLIDGSKGGGDRNIRSSWI
ncbi:hypothetical protein [Providencia hangzhouensis]|uniref:hypothetical protein n=1 Tax=Providencia hangzhouensis TaxID=3031799 RepID=UPI0034DCD997